jgi:hypothetical protein
MASSNRTTTTADTSRAPAKGSLYTPVSPPTTMGSTGALSIVPSSSQYNSSAPAAQSNSGGYSSNDIASILAQMNAGGGSSGTANPYSAMSGSPSLASGSIGGVSTASTRAVAQQQQAAMNEAQMQLLQAAVRQANAGQAFLAPSPTAYREATGVATAAVNQGIENANRYYNGGTDFLKGNMQSAVDALNKNYGLGIQAVQDFGREGVGRIDAGTAQAQAYLDQAYGRGSQALDPYTSTAGQTLSDYQNFVGGDFTGQLQEFMDSPVYQFGLGEGQKAIQNSAAARGALQSGRTLTDLDKYSNDYAAQQYFNYTNQRYGQLYDQANMGLMGSQSLASLAQGVGGAQADTSMQGALSAADLLERIGNTTGQLYGDLGTRLGVTYEDFTGMNNQIALAQAGAAYDAGKTNANYQYQGALGAGQKMYNTNYYNQQIKKG